MQEYPVRFNSEMVRAILEGRKTQRRVPMKPQPSEETMKCFDKFGDIKKTCPFGQIGDHLWVKETYYCWYRHPEQLNPSKIYQADFIGKNPFECYTESIMGIMGINDPPKSARWCPSLRMPRWASRITLEITNIRVERIQDITEEDALKEGIVWASIETAPKSGVFRPYAKEQFQRLWDSTYSKKGFEWKKNPWVWVIEFKKIEGKGSED